MEYHVVFEFFDADGEIDTVEARYVPENILGKTLANGVAACSDAGCRFTQAYVTQARSTRP